MLRTSKIKAILPAQLPRDGEWVNSMELKMRGMLLEVVHHHRMFGNDIVRTPLLEWVEKGPNDEYPHSLEAFLRNEAQEIDSTLAVYNMAPAWFGPDGCFGPVTTRRIEYSEELQANLVSARVTLAMLRYLAGVVGQDVQLAEIHNSKAIITHDLLIGFLLPKTLGDLLDGKLVNPLEKHIDFALYAAVLTLRSGAKNSQLILDLLKQYPHQRVELLGYFSECLRVFNYNRERFCKSLCEAVTITTEEARRAYPVFKDAALLGAMDTIEYNDEKSHFPEMEIVLEEASNANIALFVEQMQSIQDEEEEALEVDPDILASLSASDEEDDFNEGFRTPRTQGGDGSVSVQKILNAFTSPYATDTPFSQQDTPTVPLPSPLPIGSPVALPNAPEVRKSSVRMRLGFAKLGLVLPVEPKGGSHDVFRDADSGEMNNIQVSSEFPEAAKDLFFELSNLLDALGAITTQSIAAHLAKISRAHRSFVQLKVDKAYRNKIYIKLNECCDELQKSIKDGIGTDLIPSKGERQGVPGVVDLLRGCIKDWGENPGVNAQDDEISTTSKQMVAIWGGEGSVTSLLGQHGAFARVPSRSVASSEVGFVDGPK